MLILIEVLFLAVYTHSKVEGNISSSRPVLLAYSPDNLGVEYLLLIKLAPGVLAAHQNLYHRQAW
jgi:hypothetical protein